MVSQYEKEFFEKINYNQIGKERTIFSTISQNSPKDYDKSIKKLYDTVMCYSFTFMSFNDNFAEAAGRFALKKMRVEIENKPLYNFVIFKNFCYYFGFAYSEFVIDNHLWEKTINGNYTLRNYCDHKKSQKNVFDEVILRLDKNYDNYFRSMKKLKEDYENYCRTTPIGEYDCKNLNYAGGCVGNIQKIAKINNGKLIFVSIPSFLYHWRKSAAEDFTNNNNILDAIDYLNDANNTVANATHIYPTNLLFQINPTPIDHFIIMPELIKQIDKSKQIQKRTKLGMIEPHRLVTHFIVTTTGIF